MTGSAWLPRSEASLPEGPADTAIRVVHRAHNGHARQSGKLSGT